MASAHALLSQLAYDQLGDTRKTLPSLPNGQLVNPPWRAPQAFVAPVLDPNFEWIEPYSNTALLLRDQFWIKGQRRFRHHHHVEDVFAGRNILRIRDLYDLITPAGHDGVNVLWALPEDMQADFMLVGVVSEVFNARQTRPEDPNEFVDDSDPETLEAPPPSAPSRPQRWFTKITLVDFSSVDTATQYTSQVNLFLFEHDEITRPETNQGQPVFWGGSGSLYADQKRVLPLGKLVAISNPKIMGSIGIDKGKPACRLGIAMRSELQVLSIGDSLYHRRCVGMRFGGQCRHWCDWRDMTLRNPDGTSYRCARCRSRKVQWVMLSML